MRPDAVTLLRDLRPPDPGIAPDEDALERIVAVPPPARPGRRRRSGRRLALAIGAVATALAGAAVLPGGSPNVLARTAQALTAEDSILHFRSETRHRVHGAELATREPDAEVDERVEGWQADGGRRERSLHGESEFVRDWDARLSIAYNAERDELIRHTDPDVFGPDAGPRPIEEPSLIGGSVIGDLSRLLERARRGEENVRLVGETSVRGVDVYELRIDFTQESLFVVRDDGSDAGTVAVKASRTIFVDRERFLPVRVVDRSERPARGGEVVHSVTDYVEIERLPRTPENEKLLEMSPHPGAKEIVEGRV